MPPRFPLISLVLAGGLLLASCRAPRPVEEPAKPEPAASPAPAVKAAAGGLVPAEDVAFANKALAGKNGFLPAPDQTPAMTPQNTRFVVDLDSQRVYLYHENKLIAASKISSGMKYYRTETGDYTLGQKDLNHRSTTYGNFVNSRGGTVMSDVRNGFDPTPPGARFQGALMKYFMRFHHNGKPTAMGFHRGALPGYPASHGCVRLPEQTAAWFFKHVPMHTPILVRGTKYGVPYGASQGRPKRAPKVHSSLKKAAKPAEPKSSEAPAAGTESETSSAPPASSSAPASQSAAPAPAPVSAGEGASSLSEASPEEP